jgi:hypothetical protein
MIFILVGWTWSTVVLRWSPGFSSLEDIIPTEVTCYSKRTVAWSLNEDFPEFDKRVVHRCNAVMFDRDRNPEVDAGKKSKS